MTARVGAAVLLLAPLVLLLITSVPADLANHRGEALRGTATVTAVEPLRGGTTATYKVISATGQAVGWTDDVYGLNGETVGVSYPVNYVAPKSPDEQVAAYAVGEDPLVTNLAVLAVTGSSWLAALAHVVRRLLRLLPRRLPPQYRATGQYEAGRTAPPRAGRKGRR